MERKRIVIIGSGNIASHLAPALSARERVIQICSPHIGHAHELSSRLPEAEACDRPEDIITDADFYIIAVSDDKVADVAASMPLVSGIVAHTSGSVPMQVLARHHRHGVFYPLQTFSKHSRIDISQVPFLIEASDTDSAVRLKALASTLSDNVIDADSALRSRIHVAAVFACNFPNYMWSCASDLLNDAGLDLSLMRPLLEATLAKALAIGPAHAQTGPARRGDSEVIDRHIASLSPDKAEIYRLLSERISQKYK